MKSGFFVFTLCLFFGAALVSSSSPVPLFLWSGQRAFPEAHSQTKNVLHLGDVRQALTAVVEGAASEGALLNIVPAPVPEVLVAFVAPQLSTSDLAYATTQNNLAQLKAALATSESSLSAPFFVTGGASISSELTQWVSSDAQVVTVNAAQCDVALDSSLFSNGVTDLLVVQLDSSLNGECLEKIMTQVASNTDKYLAIFSADDASRDVRMAFPSVTAAPVAFNLMNLNASKLNAVYTGPQYISPTILFALLLGFFLIFILWQGLACLMSVETPVRFAYAPLTHSLTKEF